MNLSATVRSYMKDPIAFEKRIDDRAASLWDAYYVEPTLRTGTFIVGNEDGARYEVNVMQQTCTCEFAVKAEIPGCRCKHLRGLSGLIDEQVAFYGSQYNQAFYRNDAQGKDQWGTAHAKLVGQWNLAQREIALKAEADAVEMDVETYRRWQEENEAREVIAA